MDKQIETKRKANVWKRGGKNEYKIKYVYKIQFRSFIYCCYRHDKQLSSSQNLSILKWNFRIRIHWEVSYQLDMLEHEFVWLQLRPFRSFYRVRSNNGVLTCSQALIRYSQQAREFCLVLLQHARHQIVCIAQNTVCTKSQFRQWWHTMNLNSRLFIVVKKVIQSGFLLLIFRSTLYGWMMS